MLSLGFCVQYLPLNIRRNYGYGIGGYISELTVRNDEFDNLFGEISVYGMHIRGKISYFFLVLR